MRFVRAHQRSGAWLSLAALLVQFVVSFAHVHRDDLVPVPPEGVPSAARLDPSLPNGSRSRAPTTDHDFCTICASIALAGSLVLPQPPAVVVATAPHRTWLIDWAIVLVSTDKPRHFQARGPPV
jgi:hypothetical protein